MPSDRDLFRHLDRQLVNPLEARRDKDRETLLLMAPEFFVLDQPSRRFEQGLDIRGRRSAPSRFAASPSRLRSRIESWRISRPALWVGR